MNIYMLFLRLLTLLPSPLLQALPLLLALLKLLLRRDPAKVTIWQLPTHMTGFISRISQDDCHVCRAGLDVPGDADAEKPIIRIVQDLLGFRAPFLDHLECLIQQFFLLLQTRVLGKLLPIVNDLFGLLQAIGKVKFCLGHSLFYRGIRRCHPNRADMCRVTKDIFKITLPLGCHHQLFIHTNVKLIIQPVSHLVDQPSHVNVNSGEWACIKS